ncbi:enkurin-like [Syngnathus typhle]|uniref:enkurin-like n=1 Tax=Syngnathus typhle TaxID=161592 RepID=UPI002A69F660|nr:enkurin-like [Syngnathus typhle]XP_061155157.1 enkurin-like [Syngnathus typhle]
MAGEFYPLESIHNFIEKTVIIEKPERYVSKFRPTVLEERKPTNYMKTMGPNKLEVPIPTNYLKKHSKEPKLPEIKQVKTHYGCSLKKPAVPTGPFLPPVSPTPTKRKTTAPKGPKQPPCVVDSNKGHKESHNVNSGLVPVYIRKKDYGEVPNYLMRRKAKYQKALEEYNMNLKKQEEHETMKYLSDVECQAIVEDLKLKYNELNVEYQRLPFMIDTPSMKNRKVRLEVEMKQLEDDIKLLHRLDSICKNK